MNYAVFVVPGLGPKRVQVQEDGENLEEALSRAGLSFSNKQTYVDNEGNTLARDSLVYPGDTILVTTTVANG